MPLVDRRLWSKEGLGGLYRGIAAATMREVTYSSLRFGLYEPIAIQLDAGNKEANAAVFGPVRACFGNLAESSPAAGPSTHQKPAALQPRPRRFILLPSFRKPPPAPGAHVQTAAEGVSMHADDHCADTWPGAHGHQEFEGFVRIAKRVAAGASAGGIASATFSPTDVLKITAQRDTKVPIPVWLAASLARLLCAVCRV